MTQQLQRQPTTAWLITIMAVLVGLIPNLALAQVSAYTFSATNSNSYSAITGGTVLATPTANSTTSTGLGGGINYPVSAANLSNDFSFTFNGTTYNSINVYSNGFVTFGATASGTSNTTPISSTTGYSGAVSAFGRTLNARYVAATPASTGEIRYQLVGVNTSPQTLVIQWTRFQPSTASNVQPELNFQIRLNESDNSINIDYGLPTPTGTFTANTAQIGLRGASNADYNNRIVATNATGNNWLTASTAGTANTSSANYSYNATTPSSSNLPSATLRYTWTPPAGPTTCATKQSPTNGATVCGYGVQFLWSQVSDATGYKVIIDNDADLSSPILTQTQAGVNNLSYHWYGGAINQTYYWAVVPYNGGGDNTSCRSSIFSFTTNSASISASPYTEDFEATCALGSWTFTNHDQTRWVVNTAQADGGTRSAHIASTDNTVNRPANASVQNSYFYKDITFPAGANATSFSFRWKNPQTTASNLAVYWGYMATAPTPVGGTAITTTNLTTVLSTTAGKNQATWMTLTVPLGLGLLRNCDQSRTIRIIFHYNGGTTAAPATDGPAVDNIVISSSSATSLSGPYTIDPTGAGATNFTTFEAAIAALNNSCISSDVTFNVAAGVTFNPASLLTITASGGSNNIVFQKSGAGANPIVNFPGTATTGEAGITLLGASKITFDGITFTNTSGLIDYGFEITNANADLGSQNNKIRNSVFNLSTNLDTRAIYQNVSTATPASAAGANSGNLYEYNTFNSARTGIWLQGNSTYPDLSTIVRNNTVGTTTFGSMGGTATTTAEAAGIYCLQQTGVRINNNIVRNFNVTGTARLTGIKANTNPGQTNIYNNRVYALRNENATATTTGLVVGIAASVTASSPDMRVFNNYVGGLGSNYSGGSTLTDVHVRGLWNEFPANAGTLSWDNNTVLIDNYQSATTNYTTSRSTAYYATGTATTTVNMRGNILANITPASTGGLATNGNHYCVFVASNAHVSGTWDENDLYIANAFDGATRRGYTADNNGTSASGEQATIIDWKTNNGGKDANSVDADPKLPAVGLEGYKANGAGVNDIFTLLQSWVTDDIEGVGRGVPTDIGAYVFTPSNIDLGALAPASPLNQGCNSGTQSIVAQITNASDDPINFATANATVTVTVLLDGVQQGSVRTATISTGTLSTGGTLSVPLSPGIDMTPTGTYTFITEVTVSGDNATANNTNSTVIVRTPAATLPTVTLTFAGFTGANLTGLFPQWREGDGAASPLGSASDWVQGTIGATTTARILLSGSSDRDWIVGPKVSVTANTELRFKMAITNSSTLETTDGLTGSDNFVEVRYTEDCGLTWLTLPSSTINSANWLTAVGSPDLKQFTFTPASLVPALVGKEVTFAFFASEGISADPVTTTYVHLDDIFIREKPAQDLEVLAVAGPTELTCGGTGIPLQILVRSTGVSAYNFTSNPVGLSVTVLDPVSGSATYTGTVSTGATLAPGSTRALTVSNFNMTNLGGYTFTPSITSEAAGGDASNNTIAAEARTLYGVSSPLPVFETFSTTTLQNNFREGKGEDRPLGTVAGFTFNSTLGLLPGEQFAVISMSNTVRDWLVTPPTLLPATGELQLRWKQGVSTPATFAASDDQFLVRISTDCGQTWTTIYTADATNASAEMQQGLLIHTYGLNAYRGQTVQIGFYADGGSASNSYNIWLDEVAIQVKPATDLSAVGLISPAVGCYGAATPLTASVQNNGTTTINFASTPLTVNMAITGPSPSTPSATVSTGSLAPGASLTVSLGTINMTTTGQFVFNGSISMSGDGDAANNTFGRVTRDVQSRFTSAATSTTQFLDFSVSDNQFTSSADISLSYPGWGVGQGALTSISSDAGFGTIVSQGNGNKVFSTSLGSSLNTEYLISPRFAATAGAEFRFKLGISYSGVPDAPPSGGIGLKDDDFVSVVVSTNCGNSFTEVYRISASQNGGAALSTALTQYTVDLGSTYAGQNIFVAVFYSSNTVNGGNLYSVNVDDVLLRNAPPIDLAVSELVTPPLRGCNTGAQTLRLRLQNLGTSARNFAATNAQVRITVTPPTGAPTVYNGTINTGTTAPDGFVEVNLAPTLTMSVLGTYTFAAQILTTDGDASNNTLSFTRLRENTSTGFQQLDFESPFTGSASVTYPGWSEGSGLPYPLGTTSTWTADNFANDAAQTRSMSMTFSGITDQEWVVSPIVTATSVTRLSFDLALTSSTTSAAPVEKVGGYGIISPDDRFVVFISTDCGGTWSPLPSQDYRGNNGTFVGIPATRTNIDISLASYAGQTIRIAFFGDEGGTGLTTEFNPYKIHIDNVQFGNRFANDMELSSILAPTSDRLCRFNNTASLKVFNAGINAASFSVRATPQGAGGSPLTVAYPGTLATLAFATIEMPGLDLPYGTTSIKFEVVQTGDQDATNNERIFAIARPINGNAQAPTVTPASICANTAATLTASGGGAYEWYAAATGGTRLARAATFTTPVLTGSTTYYVQRNQATAYNVADIVSGATSTSSTLNIGPMFSLTAPTYIKSVDVYPSVANASLSITVYSPTRQILATLVRNNLGNAAAARTPVPIDLTLQPGSGYTMELTAISSGALRTQSGSSSGVAYPYTSGDGAFSITGYWVNNAPGTLTSPYYYFYNWQIETGAPCASQRTAAVVNIRATGTWTGANGSNWNDAGNWCGGVPTATTPVMIPTGVPQPSIISGSQFAQNLTLMPGSTLQSNGILSISGNISASGQQVSGDGTFLLNGTTPQTMTGILQVANFTVSNTSGASLAAGASLRLRPADATSGVLRVSPGASFNASAGSVVLYSNASGTGSLAALTGGASFTGQLTQERFVSAATSGWYFAGAPFGDATLAEWSETQPRISPLNNASIFWFQETDSSRTRANGSIAELNGWRVPANLTGLINPVAGTTRGYRVFLRSTFFNSGGRISHAGTPYQGTLTTAISRTSNQYEDGGFNLIANPYPADIDWDAVTVPAGVNDASYVWNRAANQYQVYVKPAGQSGGVAVNAGPNPDLLPSGSSFFVRTTASTNLTFTEAAKSTTSRAAYRTGAAQDLLRAFLSDGAVTDEIAIRFLPEATQAFDLAYDGAEMGGSDLNLSSIGIDGKTMAINSMPAVTARLEIPLAITAAAQGAHSLRFGGLGSFATGTTFYLEDHLLGTLWPVDESADGYAFQITSDPATAGRGRFVLIAQPANVTAVKPVLTQPMLSVWPNPSTLSDANLALHNLSGTKAVLTVTDALGRAVYRKEVAITAGAAGLRLPSLGWPAGQYVVRVSTAKEVLTQLLQVSR